MDDIRKRFDDAEEILVPIIEHSTDIYTQKLELMLRLSKSALLSEEFRSALLAEVEGDAEWCKENLRIVKRTETVVNTWYEVVEVDNLEGEENEDD